VGLPGACGEGREQRAGRKKLEKSPAISGLLLWGGRRGRRYHDCSFYYFPTGGVVITLSYDVAVVSV